MARTRFLTLLPCILAATSCLAWRSALGAEECPAEAVAELAPFDALTSAEDIVVTADKVELSRSAFSVLSGNVVIRQGDRVVRAEEATYDSQAERLSVRGDVRYQDPNIEITGTTARFAADAENGSFTVAKFQLGKRPGRGDAAIIDSGDDDVMLLQNVRYTTCPPGQNDWRLIAKHIRLDREAGVGAGRGVRVEFKSTPIFYVPYLSFPIDDQRKTGLLVPEFGRSNRNGIDVAAPFYWNLAPNYDLLLTPRYLSQRGAQLKTKFRYLTAIHGGDLAFEYLPDDDLLGRERGLASLNHQTRIGGGWNLLADINHVTDDAYFEDLGSSLSGSSITHVERRVDLKYRDAVWNVLGRAQGFQTLDQSIAPENQPYERLPQLLTRAKWADGPLGLRYDLDGEVVNFERSDSLSGVRLSVAPAVSLPLSRSGVTITPRVALLHTRYDLRDAPQGADTSLSNTAPVYSLDTRAVFQRFSGESAHFLQIVEPRVQYTHVPFKTQEQLPVFDTGLPDFNQVQLFRENRFSGFDRIGDTDRLSLGLTTRLVDVDSGRALLTATLGQAVFLSDRRVALPGDATPTRDYSNFIAEVGVEMTQSWNADFEYQWEPADSRTAKAAVRVQYRPEHGKVLNLAYRFQRGELEQSDLSFSWPLGPRWNVVGRWNYALDEDQTLERFAGLEYERCCWAARLVSRKFVNTRDGAQDSALFAQFELKGLTSVGSRADKFLERGILGYQNGN